MTTIGSRHSTVVLFSDASSIHSHRVRLVLSEKDIQAKICFVPTGQVNKELLQVNPLGTLPALADHDLSLYDVRVIIDYLDERYPHPPLMPIDPVSRARTRLALYRIETDWYSLTPEFQVLESEQAAAQLSESLLAASDVFAAMPYFFGEEYSILDATLAPLLWRLPAYGIVLPESAVSIKHYARRMFERPGFQASLSDVEREMEHT